MNFIKVFMIIFVLVQLTGCATPQAVKSLSNEQVETQKTFNNLLIIEKFTEAQKKSAINRINQRMQQQITLHEELASTDLVNVKDENKIKQDLGQLSQTVLNTHESELENIKKIEQRVERLLNHHKRIIQVQNDLLEAQIKLNEYIQLEKADELAFAGINGKIEQARSEIQNIITDINTTLSLF